MAYSLSKNFHFNANFNLYGVVILVGAALLVLVLAYLYDLLGVMNIAVFPLILAIFALGLFTGRPCLHVEDDYFEYRSGPFARLYHIEIEDIEHIGFEGGKIKVYCYGYHKPIVTIKSSSFRKSELSEVNNYFARLK